MQQLHAVFVRYSARVEQTRKAFTEWLDGWDSTFQPADRMFLEGLLSTSWQNWGLFCRRVVMASALGCRTAGGIVVNPCVTPSQWERVSHIALRVKNGRRPQPNNVNGILRHEPTWGDVNKLIAIISEIRPDNEATLLTGFGGATGGPIHAQKIRNAAAHRNHQTFLDTRELMPYYVARRISHPIEALLWEDPVSNSFAISAWLDEMLTVGHQAVQ